jgi:Fe-Mn family superoxide dismutase
MFELPKLPYDYASLEPHIDAKTMLTHHTKHHAAYIQNLNDALKGREDLLKTKTLEQLLGSIESVPPEIRNRLRNHGGGHLNHTLFWQIMTPKAKKEPSGKLAAEIKKDYGNFSTFKETFSAKAMGRFGSGWAWLAVKEKKLDIIDTPNQDTPLMLGYTPILGLDVWEHAYYLKYQNRRADYIEAWWNVVNWEEVERRLSLLLK